MNNFRKTDNNLRLKSFKKDEFLEEIFLEMNKKLLKNKIAINHEHNFPTLFIFGLPRSGTTLSYQIISQCLDIGYINNLIARFWLAPEYGIALSKLFPNDNISYDSNYGKTNNIFGPHEFAYFWHNWLNIKSEDDMLSFDGINENIKWDKLGDSVRSMQNLFNSGIVFKTMFTANYIENFSKTFNNPIFIYLERDIFDVAISILKAREKYYGDKNKWWATFPPNYKDLKNLSFDKQISGQVTSLKKIYSEVLNKVPKDKVIKISYEKICNNPNFILEKINEVLKKEYNQTIPIIRNAPLNFQFRTRNDNLNKDEKLLIEQLKMIT